VDRKDIQTRAALVRYLKEHPKLRMEYPAGILGFWPQGMVDSRVFLRANDQVFTLTRPDGSETCLAALARDLEFHEDHFAVKFPESWNTQERIRYYYVDPSETAPCPASPPPPPPA
jgi:hypothetical protein